MEEFAAQQAQELQKKREVGASTSALFLFIFLFMIWNRS